MPAKTPGIIHTSLSDRDILLHILTHVEQLTAELEEFRPLLAMAKGKHGQPDMISVLQARRELKRAARDGT